MGHRIQPFITGMQRAGEEFYYTATGTLSGLVGSKTARDLQDYYIGKKSVKFEKPYSNYNKWVKKYDKYYFIKKRPRGDWVVPETTTEDEVIGKTDGPFFKASSSNHVEYKHYRSYKRSVNRKRSRKNNCKCSYRSPRRMYNKSRMA